jgi:hypothetical protein
MATAKKYTDFPAGTYDTSKIFLQADPTTGDLEKVNLPSLSGNNPLIVSLAPDSNNTGSGLNTCATYAIPAGSGIQPGTVFEVWSFFHYLTSSGSKTIRLDLGLQSLSLYTNTSIVYVQLYSKILFGTTTSYFFFNWTYQNNSITSSNGPSVLTFNPAVSNNLVLSMQGSASNDIKFKAAYFKRFDL